MDSEGTLVLKAAEHILLWELIRHFLVQEIKLGTSLDGVAAPRHKVACWTKWLCL